MFGYRERGTMFPLSLYPRTPAQSNYYIQYNILVHFFKKTIDYILNLVIINPCKASLRKTLTKNIFSLMFYC